MLKVNKRGHYTRIIIQNIRITLMRVIRDWGSRYENLSRKPIPEASSSHIPVVHNCPTFFLYELPSAVVTLLFGPDVITAASVKNTNSVRMYRVRNSRGEN